MPLMVIILDAHTAVTPAGKLVGIPIPVAPVVVCVIGVRAVLIHKVVVVPALTVLFGSTVTTIVEEVLLQPAALVTMTSTIWPLVSVVVVYVVDAPFCTLVPFTLKL
jgi:hypothetical protein